jgi:hypothetical protein
MFISIETRHLRLIRHKNNNGNLHIFEAENMKRVRIFIRAGHNWRQFDELPMTLLIDIVNCQLSIDLRNSMVGLFLQN